MLFNKKDILLIGVLVLLALMAYLLNAWMVGGAGPSGGTGPSGGAGPSKHTAQVMINGQIAIIIDLSIDKEIVLESLPMVRFKVLDNAVAFVASDCPDQICVHNGFLSRPGQMAVCLPNRTSLSIIHEDVDIIAH